MVKLLPMHHVPLRALKRQIDSSSWARTPAAQPKRGLRTGPVGRPSSCTTLVAAVVPSWTAVAS